MSWIKRFLVLKLTIFLFFFLLSIKVFDFAVGLISDLNDETQDIKKYSTSLKTDRTLLLKENLPNLNTVIKPDKKLMLGTQNLMRKDFVVRTDADGFIIGPRDFIHAKDKVSIIFFGGSTTECIHVEEERRFPYLVSLNLNVRVLNGGISGGHSMHSLLSLIGKGIPYKPNHIILMHAVNDLTTLSKTLSYWGEQPEGRSLIQKESKIVENVGLYRVARSVKNFLVPNLWLKISHIFQVTAEKTPQDEWAALRDRKYKFSDIENAMVDQFTASLKSFVAVSREWGIEPILMTQFNRVKKDDLFVREAYERYPQPISYDDFVRLYQKTNGIVRTVAKQEKVFLIDLDTQIPSTKEYIYDAVHLNTKGSEIVAEKITTALRSRYPSIYK